MNFRWVKSFFRRWLWIISCLSLMACGFVGDETVKNNDIYNNNELSASCRIDPDAFTQILEKDIQAQIQCLEKNFEQFSKYVKRERPDAIGKRELGVFISDFFPANATTIIDALGLLFKVNLIFIDDERDQIATDGMRRLFKLLAAANREAARVNQAFAQYDAKEIGLTQLRRTFVDALAKLAQAGVAAMPQNKHASVSISQTIDEVASRFSALKMSPGDIKLAQTIKLLLSGGKPDIVTCDELRGLLVRMPSLAELIFDLLYIKEYQLSSMDEYVSFAVARIDLLFKHLELERDGVIISHEDLSQLVARTNLNDDIALLEQTSRLAKTHLFSPEDAQSGFNAHDLKLLQVYAKVYLRSYQTWTKLTSITARADFEAILKQWAAELNDLIDPTLFPKEIALTPFLDEFARLWQIDNTDTQLLSSIMLAKPLLIGGKASIISPLELERLLPKLLDIGLLVFDVFNFSQAQHEKREWYRFALEMLQNFKKVLHTGDDYEIAFLTKDLKSLKILMGDKELPLFNGIVAAFPAIKSKLYGGHSEVVLFKEFRALLGEVTAVVETLHLSELTLDLYHRELQTKKKLTTLPYRHHSQYRDFSPARIAQFKSEFKHVFAKYQYFLDEENLQTYQSSLARNRHGFTLNLMLRHVARIILSRYGHMEYERPMLSLKEIDAMMWQFKPLLEPLGLWTKKIETFARNMLLLSDLFQNSSNGNGAMDIDEAVEYIGMVLMSAEIQGRMMAAYPKHCANKGSPEEPAFDTSCYRPIFFKLLFDELKLDKKLPKLKAYIEEAPAHESQKFLRAVEGFARDIDDESIPMGKRDLVLLIGAMLNIESTFVRYDQIEENNQLDQNELDQAYYTYRDGIVMVAELDEDQAQYTKSIFLYMVAKMEKPAAARLFIFHNNPLRGNIVAKRLNIGTLLYYLVQE